MPFAVWGKSPQIDPQDFLLKFTTGPREQLSEEEQERAMQASKARWRAAFGAKTNGQG